MRCIWNAFSQQSGTILIFFLLLAFTGNTKVAAQDPNDCNDGIHTTIKTLDNHGFEQELNFICPRQYKSLYTPDGLVPSGLKQEFIIVLDSTSFDPIYPEFIENNRIRYLYPVPEEHTDLYLRSIITDGVDCKTYGEAQLISLKAQCEINYADGFALRFEAKALESTELPLLDDILKYQQYYLDPNAEYEIVNFYLPANENGQFSDLAGNLLEINGDGSIDFTSNSSTAGEFFYGLDISDGTFLYSVFFSIFHNGITALSPMPELNCEVVFSDNRERFFLNVTATGDFQEGELYTVEVKDLKLSEIINLNQEYSFGSYHIGKLEGKELTTWLFVSMFKEYMGNVNCSSLVSTTLPVENLADKNKEREAAFTIIQEPNTSHFRLVFEGQSGQSFSFELIDINGRTLWQHSGVQTAGKNELETPVLGLNEGLFLVLYKQNNALISSQKFIKK